jgi:hypothetical protein
MNAAVDAYGVFTIYAAVDVEPDNFAKKRRRTLVAGELPVVCFLISPVARHEIEVPVVARPE